LNGRVDGVMCCQLPVKRRRQSSLQHVAPRTSSSMVPSACRCPRSEPRASFSEREPRRSPKAVTSRSGSQFSAAALARSICWAAA
jgi:hypothetical protein